MPRENESTAERVADSRDVPIHEVPTRLVEVLAATLAGLPLPCRVVLCFGVLEAVVLVTVAPEMPLAFGVAGLAVLALTGGCAGHLAAREDGKQEPEQ